MADDFENVDIPTASDIAAMTQVVSPTMPSRFARVLFQLVPEAYSAGTDIACRYLVTSALTPTNSDWIGVFRIGWRTPADYVQYTWAKVVLEEESQPAEVQFAGSHLPTDDGDFYQFCYVTRDGQVGGASTPFQFIRPSAGGGAGFVTLDDEEDAGLVIVTPRVIALEADLKRAAEREDKYAHDKRQLEKKCNDLLDKMSDLTEKMADHESQLNSAVTQRDNLTRKAQKYQKQASEFQICAVNATAEKDELSKAIAALNKEIESLKEHLASKESEMGALQMHQKTLVNENDELRGTARALIEQKTLVENHASTTDEKITTFQREIANLQREKIILVEAASKLKAQLCEQTRRDYQVIKMCKVDIELVKEQLRNCEDKLSAAEHSKQLCSVEVSAVQEAHAKMGQDLEKATAKVHKLHDALSVCKEQKELSDLEKSELINLLEETQRQLEESRENATAKIDVLSGQKDQSELEKSELANLLQETRRQLDESHKESSVLESRLQTLATDSSSPATPSPDVSEAALYALSEAHVSLREQCVAAKRQHAGCARQMEQLVADKMSLEERDRELRSEVVDLRERLLMGEEHYKRTFIECALMKRELRKLRKQVSQTSTCDQMEKTPMADASSTMEKITTIETSSVTEQIAMMDISSGTEKTVTVERSSGTEQMETTGEVLTSRGTMQASSMIAHQMSLLTGGNNVPALQPTPHSRHVAIHIQPKPNAPIPAEDDTELDAVVKRGTGSSGLYGTPLTPLPAPIQPTVLPSAKAAAVKAVCTGLSQSGTTTTESETGETEVTGILGNDAGGGDPCVTFTEDVASKDITAADTTCPVCEAHLGAGLSDLQVWRHVELHYARECPLCLRCFTPADTASIDDTAGFFQHVEDHFLNDEAEWD